MRWLVLSAALSLAACDGPTDPPADGPVVYQDVEVEARGDASLAVSDGALVVSGLDGSRSGGFTVAGTPDRVDVEIDPLAVASGARFGVTVEDESGQELASLFNVGQGDGVVEFEFAFADALPVEAVALTYRLGGRDGQVVLEGVLGLGARRQGRRASASAGSGEGSTGSTHVVRENGRYVVVSDSNAEEARADCAGFIVTPPVALEASGEICTDWIEVEPLGAFEMPRGRVSVTARGVGSFRVNELAAR